MPKFSWELTWADLTWIRVSDETRTECTATTVLSMDLMMAPLVFAVLVLGLANEQASSPPKEKCPSGIRQDVKMSNH